jgi:bifunctional ADP-heptose synthase (sugar kinase/adenylyltransferase)
MGYLMQPLQYNFNVLGGIGASMTKSINDVRAFINNIREYNPDIMVIGDDYNYDSIIGKEFIPEIKFFEKIPGKSTSKILSYGKTNSL